MALFVPRTFPEIFSDMLARLLAATPLNDLNYGSVFTTLLEASAQEDDEQYFQMLEIIRGYSIDTTTGTDLDERAEEYGLEREEAKEASTTVTISDTAITKISTGVYSGLSGAVAGSTSINGDSATGFPVVGSIIVGRGTPNAETVAYSSITTFANYARFNLSSGLAKDHGTDETIIFSQGGARNISAGTVVMVPSSDTLEQVSFTLDANATILDGESSVADVPVTANEPGSKANVPVGAINQFDSKPFSTATVRNLQRVTNGLDLESDQELRDRIKATVQSLSRGTAQSIITGVQGLVSVDDNKRVVSATLRDVTSPAQVVKLFIDDGSGFIPSFSRVGYEVLVANATGGEQYIKTSNFPLVKAFAETESEEPFNIPNNSTLFVEVNGIAETITFVDSDFAAPGAALAQEVLIKINANAASFEARVSSGGSKVRLFARSNSDEEIQVTGGTANGVLDFPIDTKYTTKLYLVRDNFVSLLSKDGKTASIESGNTAAYNLSADLLGLSVVVDGAVNNIQKIWFRPSDFTNPASVGVVSASAHINARVSGFSCEPSSNDTRISFISNKARTAASKIRVLSDFGFIYNEESSVNVDRTDEFATSLGNIAIFATNGDYVHLGHPTVPFDTVYVNLATPAGLDILPVFEYWDGSVWKELGVNDGTEGFTQSGHITYMAPADWAVTAVDGQTHFWLRIQRTAASIGTTAIESRIRISGANEVFGFDDGEVVGADNDYEINRFVGQIELKTPLQAADMLTLGSYETRGYVVSTQATSFNGLVGQVLTVDVDDLGAAITFVSGDFVDTMAATPVEIAAAINARLPGVKATVVNSGTSVKIQTNTVSTLGSIQVSAGGANTILGFPTAVVNNLESHQPAMESATEPFSFTASDTLIVVMDGNLVNNFVVPLFRESTLTAVNSTTEMVDTTLNPIFTLDTDLEDFDFYVVDGPQMGQTRSVTAYDAATGELTLSSAIVLLAGVKYQILPTTAKNVVDFLNNKQITLLSNKAEIRTSDSGTKVQLASLVAGESASVAVTGGSANTELLFPAEVNGIDGYRYFTGLLQKVQWTVDGREDDQETYPGLRAAGVQVEALEPVTIPVSFDVEITTREGVAIGTIVSNIKSAISNYINRLQVGQDVILSEVIVAIKAVSGVFDVDIRSPSANIAIADNEQARISDDSIFVA